MVVEVYGPLVWALPSGWHRSEEEFGYAWEIGPGGNPRSMPVGEVVAKTLLVHLHPLRSRVDSHTLQMLGNPSWRMHPEVALLLTRALVARDVIRPELDGSVSMFGWPIECDPRCPIAHGDPRTWSQGAYPYVELGWVATSGPTD